MMYEIKNLGEIGIITDLEEYEIPDNAFTDGQNVRFSDGKVEKFKGHSQVFGANPITPYWGMPYNNQTAYYWIIGSSTKLYLSDMAGNWTNITRQTGGSDEDYSVSLDNNWNGGVLTGSVPIMNNINDYPQTWDGDTGNRAENLRYDSTRTWADVNYKASVIRPFKTFLVALDINKNGTRYSNLLKWSSSATPGLVPDTWDESDATQDAGETLITESSGFLIDALPLRDNLMIYSEDATHGMQYIGGRFVFRIYRLFSDGIISRRCMANIKGSQVTFAANDLILHDGHSANSILDKRNRKYLYNNIDSDNYSRSFVVPNYRLNEIWFCYPQSGSSLPDQALVWNYNDNTYGFRDLPDTPYIGYGIVDPQDSQVIDDDTGIIDLDDSLIDARNYNPTIYYPLLLGSNCFQGDQTEQFNGSNFTSYVERTGLHLGTERTKYISRIIPHIVGTGSVTISIGTQQYPEDTISYRNYTFTPGTDWKIDTRITGRLISYKVQSTGNITWSMSSIGFEVQDAGDR